MYFAHRELNSRASKAETDLCVQYGRENIVELCPAVDHRLHALLHDAGVPRHGPNGGALQQHLADLTHRAADARRDETVVENLLCGLSQVAHLHVLGGAANDDHVAAVQWTVDTCMYE